MVEAVPECGVQRRKDERVLGGGPGRDSIAHHPVDVPVLGDVVGVLVIGAESDPLRPELLDEREQRTQVPRHRRLADEEPHAGPQPLAPFLDGERLVVRADSGGGVGVQLLTEDARRVAVHMRRPGESELRQLGGVAGDDAREVHHLGDPQHPPAAEEALEVALSERPARRLESRGRDARRSHEVDVERQIRAEVEQPVDAVRAEHVRELVRVGDHGRRPEREHEPRELVREQLRRLEVHVRVDEARDDVAARGVDLFLAGVVAESGHVAVGDRDVVLEPLAREDREDVAAADDDIRRLVAAGDRDSPGQLHLATIPVRPIRLPAWRC